MLFVYASGTTMQDGNVVEMTKNLLASGALYLREPFTFMGFTGKPAGYFIMFCICGVAYLAGWLVMKTLVPKYSPIIID